MIATHSFLIMKTTYFFLLSLAIVLSGAGNVFAWEGTVVRVLDGDSLLVKKEGRIYEIRLYGIDTPEFRQPYSNKAKKLTRRLTDGQTVTVEKMDIDRYKRIVALMYSRGKLVNRELVAAGLAWFYPRYCLEQPLCRELQALEKKARTERRGLWQDAAPIAPWEWKRRQRSSESWNRKNLHFPVRRRGPGFFGDSFFLQRFRLGTA